MRGSKIHTRLVLIGAGNTNLQVLRRWAMAPLPGVELFVVNPQPHVVYSGMVPGFVGGRYRWEEIHVDLVRLCGRAGVFLVVGRAERVDVVHRRIEIQGRAPLHFDLAVLNVGSVPEIPPGSKPSLSIGVKPLSESIESLERLDETLRDDPPFHLTVVGSGAGGGEMALALRRRYRHLRHLEIHLVEAAPRVLPAYPRRVSRIFQREMQDRAIRVHTGFRAVRVEGNRLRDGQGAEIPCDGIFWTTRAAPPPILAASGLERDDRGFVRVRDTLVTHADPDVFASGDCVSLDSHPNLPKAGVFAVRQGPVLWENLKRRLHGRPLKPYRPQKVFLTLLNTADDRAVLSYGRVVARGAWAWKLKDRIDRRWMRRFQDFSRFAAMDNASPMRCGGCGAKVPGVHLAEALKDLDPDVTSGLEVGLGEREDAAVVRLAGGSLAVESVDFFRAFLGDPHLVGQVAAQNALSDLHAMNAEPVLAQVLAVLPEAPGRLHQARLREILAGVQAALRDSGARLGGGHTTEGAELAVGLAVTGSVEPGRWFSKGRLRAGDRLVLGKALGTGMLLAAYGQGECRHEWWAPLLASLRQSNGAARRVLAAAGVGAATDVTGFGLAGHLAEMLRASGVGARVWLNRLPLLPGVESLLGSPVRSTLHEGNRALVPLAGEESARADILFDPQTSGGLLAGVPRDGSEAVVRALKEAGYAHAAVIGEVTEAPAGAEPPLRLS